MNKVRTYVLSYTFCYFVYPIFDLWENFLIFSCSRLQEFFHDFQAFFSAGLNPLSPLGRNTLSQTRSVNSCHWVALFWHFLPHPCRLPIKTAFKHCYNSVFSCKKLKVKLFTCLCSPFVRRTIIHNPFSRTIAFIKLSLTKIVRVLLFLTQWSIPKKR